MVRPKFGRNVSVSSIFFPSVLWWMVVSSVCTAVSHHLSTLWMMYFMLTIMINRSVPLTELRKFLWKVDSVTCCGLIQRKTLRAGE